MLGDGNKEDELIPSSTTSSNGAGASNTTATTTVDGVPQSERTQDMIDGPNQAAI